MDSGAMMPSASGQLIAETSKDVQVVDEGVKKIASLIHDRIKDGRFTVKNWKEHLLHPKTMDKAAIDWIFVADTLNFSFWSDDSTKKYMVKYGGKEHTGYWSLCAAMNRAIDEGIPITNPHYYATINRKELANILRSDSEYDMPLIDERLEILQSTGKVLLKKYDGSFLNCIKKSEKSSQALLKMVVSDFDSYRDEADYNGKRIAMYKRAQILIADVWACCEGKGLGEFDDIDSITMFADYRIPQALVFFGAMKYTDSLMDLLKKETMMKNGDRLEIEIRGCSLWATELINREIKRLLKGTGEYEDAQVNAILIDHFLWDYRRDFADEMADIPFHRVRCIYY